MRVGDRVSTRTGQVGVVTGADLTPGMVDILLDSGLHIRKPRAELTRVREARGARPNPGPRWTRLNPKDELPPETLTEAERVEAQRAVEPTSPEELARLTAQEKAERVEAKKLRQARDAEIRSAAAAELTREKAKIERDLSFKKSWSGAQYATRVVQGAGFITREDPPRLTIPRKTAVSGNPIDQTAYYLVLTNESVTPFSHWVTNAEVQKYGLKATKAKYERLGLTEYRPTVRSYSTAKLKVKDKGLRAKEIAQSTLQDKRRKGAQLPDPDAFVEDGKYLVYFADKEARDTYPLTQRFAPYLPDTFVSTSASRRIETQLAEKYRMAEKTADLFLDTGVLAESSTNQFYALSSGKSPPAGTTIRVGFTDKANSLFFSWRPSNDIVEFDENLKALIAVDPENEERAKLFDKTARVFKKILRGYRKLAWLREKDDIDEPLSLVSLKRALGGRDGFFHSIATAANWLSKTVVAARQGNQQALQILGEVDPDGQLLAALGTAQYFGLIRQTAMTGSDGQPAKGPKGEAVLGWVGSDYTSLNDLTQVGAALRVHQSPWVSVFNYLETPERKAPPYPLESIVAEMERTGLLSPEIALSFRNRWKKKVWEKFQAPEDLRAKLLNVQRVHEAYLDPDDIPLLLRSAPAGAMYGKFPLREVLAGINTTLTHLQKHAENLQVPPGLSQKKAEEYVRNYITAGKGFARDMLTTLGLYTLLRGHLLAAPLSTPRDTLVSGVAAADAPPEALLQRAIDVLTVKAKSERLPGIPARAGLRSTTNAILFKTYNPLLFYATQMLWNSGKSLYQYPDLLQAIDTVGVYGTALRVVQESALLTSDEEEARARIRAIADYPLKAIGEGSLIDLKSEVKKEDGTTERRISESTVRMLLSKGGKFTLFHQLWPLGTPPIAAVSIVQGLASNTDAIMSVLRQKFNQAMKVAPGIKVGTPLGTKGVSALIAQLQEGKVDPITPDEAQPARIATRRQLQGLLQVYGGVSFRPENPKEEARALLEFRRRMGLATRVQRPSLRAGEKATFASPDEIVYDAPVVAALLRLKARAERGSIQPLEPFEKLTHGRPYTSTSIAGQIPLLESASGQLDEALLALKRFK